MLIINCVTSQLAAVTNSSFVNIIPIFISLASKYTEYCDLEVIALPSTSIDISIAIKIKKQAHK